MNKVNSIQPKDLEGFAEDSYRPYTDYDQEIVDWLKENAGFEPEQRFYPFIFSQSGSFYTHHIKYKADVYYTNEQFKEWIGMTNKEFKLEDLVSGKHVVEYRDGSRRLVLDVGWVGVDKYRNGFDKYLTTMEHEDDTEATIVKVYQLKNARIIPELLNDSNLILVWERKEAPVETAQEKAKKEAEAQLSELSKQIEALQKQAEAIKESVGKM